MLLAIDVGNTATKAAISGSGASFEVRSEVTSTKILGLIEEISSKKPEFAAVASVQPLFNDFVTEVLERHSVPFQLLNDANAGIPNHYETPSTLGSDRLANALYLHEQGRFPAVCVDFGTATKLDVLDAEGAYLGGAIVPGVRMMIESLSKGTAQLPEIELEAPSRAIGRSTKECLQSGTILALAEAVEGLLNRFKEELGVDPSSGSQAHRALFLESGEVTQKDAAPKTENLDPQSKVPIVATGGLAKFMAPLCPSISRIEPHLTLEGLLIAARRWAAAR